jgi:hypothetical protein
LERLVISIPSSSSSALAILQQANRTTTDTNSDTASQPDLVATVAGQSKKHTVSVERQPSQAQSSLSDAAMQLIGQKETERKAQLIKSLGQAFGVDEDKFTSNFDYASAVSDAIKRIKGSPNGNELLKPITKKLELDKLGVTLDTMLMAINVPSSDDGKKLDAAIAKEFDIPGQQKLSSLQHASEALDSVQQDDDGTYQPSSTARNQKGHDRSGHPN